MEEGPLLVFQELFSEVKRRLHNQDNPTAWKHKCVQFMRALSVKPLDKPGGLPSELDAIWHETLLNTQQYEALCLCLRGCFIHHQTASEQDDPLARRSRMDETVIAYRKRYREEPDRGVWEIVEEDDACEVEAPIGDYQVFIKTLTGKTLSATVCATKTIHFIKMVIEQKEGIPICLQRLIYGGQTLDDNKQVWDYGISSCSTLHLCLRVSGC